MADLESSLEPFSTAHPKPSHSSTTPIARHVPNSASYKVVSTDPRFYAPPHVFKGEDCIEHFIDGLQDDAQKITEILNVNVPHHVSDINRRRMISEATECYLCKGSSSPSNPFVLDHSHTDSCNVNYKPEKWNINVLIHNAKGYDTHFIPSHADM